MKNQISISEEMAFVKFTGSGLAVTTIANPETQKNFGIVISEDGNAIGESPNVEIGVSTDNLSTPNVRIEFENPKSVIVLINQLNKVLMDMQK